GSAELYLFWCVFEIHVRRFLRRQRPNAWRGPGGSYPPTCGRRSKRGSPHQTDSSSPCRTECNRGSSAYARWETFWWIRSSRYLVPEGKLMAHVLVNIAARIIPEEPPVGVPVRIELVLRRLAQKRFPDDMLAGHIGIDGPRPLRLAMRRVAIHVRMNRRYLPD